VEQTWPCLTVCFEKDGICLDHVSSDKKLFQKASNSLKNIPSRRCATSRYREPVHEHCQTLDGTVPVTDTGTRSAFNSASSQREREGANGTNRPRASTSHTHRTGTMLWHHHSTLPPSSKHIPAHEHHDTTLAPCLKSMSQGSLRIHPFCGGHPLIKTVISRLAISPSPPLLPPPPLPRTASHHPLIPPRPHNDAPSKR
jgi:hypothetical protein